jgi:Flp pilus assembly pilin Flp
MNEFKHKGRTFIRDEDGAVASEYALLVTLISVSIIAGVYALGQSVHDYYTSLVGSFGTVNP